MSLRKDLEKHIEFLKKESSKAFAVSLSPASSVPEVIIAKQIVLLLDAEVEALQDLLKPESE